MIRVVVHPQSIIHSMVAFRDGSVIAQMGLPDMKAAIAYALSYPERLPLGQPPPSFASDMAMSFAEPDLEKFPCLALAVDACRRGGTLPAVLNAANEVAVHAFLEERAAFTAIPQIVQRTMDAHEPAEDPSLEAILAADRWARAKAAELVISGR
jgi:1-deoxy-D-xylulose-5-phosphate reductoisomerase